MKQHLQVLLLSALAMYLVACRHSTGPAVARPQMDLQIFQGRLKSIASAGNLHVVDCGLTSLNNPGTSVGDCGLRAFQDHKAFFLGYHERLGESIFGYGLTGDPGGHVFAVGYQSSGFPAVAPNRGTQLLDDNHTRVTECFKPVKLDKTSEGILACYSPVNRQESEIAAHQKPIDTTVCEVLESPPRFNNKLVRIRGHYGGNFEYSLLDGDGCHDSLWFTYGGGAPPSLVAHVSGAGAPGAEDAEGKWILPVPVKLVRDVRFKRFERLNTARAQVEDGFEKMTGDFTSYCVSATFVGRIDAVTSEVHEFRKVQPPIKKVDYLGFGQMGLFEAQFVMQSVQDDAILRICEQ